MTGTQRAARRHEALWVGGVGGVKGGGQGADGGQGLSASGSGVCSGTVGAVPAGGSEQVWITAASVSPKCGSAVGARTLRKLVGLTSARFSWHRRPWQPPGPAAAAAGRAAPASSDLRMRGLISGEARSQNGGCSGDEAAALLPSFSGAQGLPGTTFASMMRPAGMAGPWQGRAGQGRQDRHAMTGFALAALGGGRLVAEAPWRRREGAGRLVGDIVGVNAVPGSGWVAACGQDPGEPAWHAPKRPTRLCRSSAVPPWPGSPPPQACWPPTRRLPARLPTLAPRLASRLDPQAGPRPLPPTSLPNPPLAPPGHGFRMLHGESSRSRLPLHASAPPCLAGVGPIMLGLETPSSEPVG